MMQVREIFLVFCTGHLAGDFVLQTHALVERKRAGSFAAYLQHGLAHFLATTFLAALFAPSVLSGLRFYAILLAILVAHLLIDWGKLHFTATGAIVDTLTAFLADQALHFFTLGAGAILYTRGGLEDIRNEFLALQSHRVDILAVLAVYAGVVFAGGYAIRYLTRPLLQSLTHLPGESQEELRNAGLYIGWLERILVLTAVILRSPATVGLVLTAKSIVRYPEIKSGRFAEYFLIGTLLSILIALMGGVLLLKILYGQVRFTP